MLVWDNKWNVLRGFRCKEAIPPDPTREISEEYKSLDRYLSKGVYEDVQEEFLPALYQCLKIGEEDEDLLSIADIKVEKNDAGYWDDRDWKVKIKFQSSRFMEDAEHPTEYLTVMSIPSVKENGTLLHERKEYTFIRMMEQEATISYEDKDAVDKVLKLKLAKGTINIEFGSRGPVLQMSDDKNKSGLKSYSLVQAMFATAFREDFDYDRSMALWNEFRNSSIKNIPANETELQDMASCVIANRGATDGMDYINKVAPKLIGEYLIHGRRYDMYKSTDIRSQLNDMLSLDRAVGEILAEDVYSVINPGRMLYSAGSVITKNMVARCKREGVYNLIIRNNVNFEGYYFTEYVFVDWIPKGTKMIPILKEALPEETGMYASQDYNLHAMGRSVVFTDEMRITKNVVELLRACGYSSVKASEKPGMMTKQNKDEVVEFSFADEVLSNRMFRSKDVGLNIPYEWVYLNNENKFVPPTEYWTTWDLAALLSFTTKLFQGKYINLITNSDIGFRKKLVMVEEMYHRAFRHAVREGFTIHNRSLKEKWAANPGNFKHADVMDNKFYRFSDEFFKYLRDTMKCLSVLGGEAITNPLAYMSAMTKINVWTANRHSVADSQRRIAIGSFGRVDAYEIPQSHKMGVVLNRAIGCETDLDGIMRVAYRRLRHEGTQTFLTDTIISMTVAEEEQQRIADIVSLPWDGNGCVHDNTKLVLCKCPSVSSLKRHTFTYLPISQIDYVTVHANQYLGIASAAIPHLCSNDAARVVFGVAQEKQAKGLVNPEWPRVMTSVDTQVPAMNDFYSIVAPEDGEVVGISKNTTSKDISLWVRFKGQGITEGKSYIFNEYDSGNSSVTVRHIHVKEGDTFEKGDVLVSSNFVKDGVLTLGVNALVAYCPDGYNYEDGVHASTSFCNRLSSYKLKTETFDNVYRKASSYNVTHASYGRWLRPTKDNCVTVDSKLGRSGEPRSFHYKLKKAKGFLESYSYKTSGRGGRTQYDGVNVDVVSIDPFSPGDKLTNRHGNKGVMPRSENNSRMLRLMNGRPLDIVYNPHGLPSRMNSGQTDEAPLGLCMYILDIHIIDDPFNGVSPEEIQMLMKYVYELANSNGDPRSICSRYPEIPNEVHTRACNRIEQIRTWAGCFDERGEGYLINPVNGEKITESKVLIGVIYVEKLIQESDSKAHARGGEMSGEDYTSVADAPTHGSSKGGGQRYGSMEFDALCADGASALISELVNERGDNAIARTNMNLRTYLPSDAYAKYVIESRGQRRSVTQFLYTMLALGVRAECDDDEFIELSRSNSDEGYWTYDFIARYNAESEEDVPNKKDQKKKNEEGSSNDTNEFDEAIAALANLAGV